MVTKTKGKKEQKDSRFMITVGKRKKAIARARFAPGKGRIRVNSVPIELVPNEIVRLRMNEPVLLVGDQAKAWDVKVSVSGGGPMGQADAVRIAIAKGLAQGLGDETRQAFLAYDRSMIVADPRRTETHKPPHSSWGARRYKQRSKR